MEMSKTVRALARGSVRAMPANVVRVRPCRFVPDTQTLMSELVERCERLEYSQLTHTHDLKATVLRWPTSSALTA